MVSGRARKAKDVSAGQGDSNRASRRELHLGRSQSEQVVTLSHRPSISARRTKSLGTLENILSKTSREFEEILERDGKAISEIRMGKNLSTVPALYKERWKQAREVSSTLTQFNQR